MNKFNRGNYIWTSVWNNVDDPDNLCKDNQLIKQFFIASIENVNDAKIKKIKVEIDRLICGEKIISETINYK